MNFNSDKRKIDKIINKQIDQSYIANQQQSTDNNIKHKYKKMEPSQTAFKGFVTLYKDTWQLMALANNFDPPLGDPWMGSQYRNWTVEFPRFDSRLIPYITVEMELRVAGGNIDDGVIIRAPAKAHFFNVEDIEDGTSPENIVKLMIYACLSFSDPNVTMPYEAKVLIGYSNPQINI